MRIVFPQTVALRLYIKMFSLYFYSSVERGRSRPILRDNSTSLRRRVEWVQSASLTLDFWWKLFPCFSNDFLVLLLGSINLICVPIGCFVSGAVTQPFGRKRSMMMLNIPFFIVWVLYYNATSVTTLYIALIISGLAGGLHEAPVM